MKNDQILMDLGLSEHETNAYLSLLRLGGSIASVVAKDMGVKRTTVYPILQTLTQKGFAMVYFRKNKRYFYAVKPNKLSGLFEKKLQTFNSIIPFLETLEKKEIQTLGLRFIETKEELKHFYNTVLEEYKNKQYCVIGSVPAWEGIDAEYFMQFRKNRAKNNIRTKLLLSADSKDTNPTEEELLRSFKYLPEKYRFKSTIDIFDDKILIISPEISSLAVVIAIPAMVDVFKSVFEIIWDSTSDSKNI